MSKILQLLNAEEYTPMEALFTAEEGRAGAVVTFLAILELVKAQSINLVQAGPFARIHVKLGSFEAP